ncbi:hypothetical protein K488DRAFT_75244 [Vararia minispora EC-137]|uniref:Uncharacterized protein n=1 Tax=Vararia minispora EC-137 TaxID=1314806 RepID=A0ACB8Q4T7_9AGAM|nr:hypothetical protein K488DRAFT_75244 [Vararia minispora EC-137]
MWCQRTNNLAMYYDASEFRTQEGACSTRPPSELEIQEVAHSVPSSPVNDASSHYPPRSFLPDNPSESLQGPPSRSDVLPPFIIALTGARFTNISLVIGLGIPRAVSAAHGHSAATTLDWIIGIPTALLSGYTLAVLISNFADFWHALVASGPDSPDCQVAPDSDLATGRLFDANPAPGGQSALLVASQCTWLPGIARPDRLRPDSQS